ncbi:hypothetical protein DENSPDRAFT_831357 [Dentipellis sp. KUC8613]|nr:hypothetical protein DENSPDRAFT_831357 [Dentipellis sp. KUC8613]
MPPQPRRKQGAMSSSSKTARAGDKKAQTQPVTSQPTPTPRMTATTAAQPKKKQSATTVLLVFPILAVLAGLSLTTFLYRRVLDPLYGGVPTQRHLDKIIWAASITGGLAPSLPGWLSLLVSGILLCAMPNTSYWVALYTGRWGDPVYGPLVTHIVVLFPVMYFGVSLIRKMVLYIEASSEQQSMMRYTVLPACASSISGFQAIWAEVPYLADYIYSDDHLMLAMGSFAVITWAITSPHRAESTAGSETKPQKMSSFLQQLVLPAILLPLLPTIMPLLRSPVLPQPLTSPYTNPESTIRILSSVPSVTGMIVVGESLPPPDWQPGMPEQFPYLVRYLRASHSLLGGVWWGAKISSRSQIMVPQVDQAGRPLGDTIYTAFNLQEAVRLVDKKDRDITEEKDNALIIGLGAGTAATALARQKVQTTIVEIDPAVYNASRQFFGLPDPGEGRVFLEDARSFVMKRRRQIQSGESIEKFDYVIHDCFSGGGVPAHLYSLEFWEDLKVLMNPDGVVAVNFAGLLGSLPSKATLYTLQKSFGQCRAFHDGEEPLTTDSKEFINMVYFCSPSTKPLEFRKPRESDFLGSHLRAHVFETLADREVDFKLIRGESEEDGEKYVLKDQNNKLNAWQADGALDHWKVMRSILPEPFWATY